MVSVLVVSGGLAEGSRVDLLACWVADALRAEGADVRELRIRDLPPGPLLWRHLDHPGISAAIDLVDHADALVVVSPVLQASFAGAVKAFLDLLGMNGLRGTDALPLMVGGSTAHVLALDYALRPVLAALGARVAPGRYVLSAAVSRDASGRPVLAGDVETEVRRAVDQLLVGLREGVSA